MAEKVMTKIDEERKNAKFREKIIKIYMAYHLKKYEYLAEDAFLARMERVMRAEEVIE